MTGNMKEKIKHFFHTLWEKMKPYLKAYIIKIQQLWKKHHITKVLILVVLVLGFFTSLYFYYYAKTTNVSTLKAGLEQVTTIYDKDENEAGTLYAQKGTFSSIDEISPQIVDALISTEDQRFYKHKGFDVIGIGRAAVGMLLNRGTIVGGGSTVTQQLAKNSYLTLDQTMLRKLKELFIALEIEKNYTKDEILEMYLNKSYFGNGVWGIEDASQKYFGKTAQEVSISEAATLVGLLKAPSHYNPIDNYDRAISRRNTVLYLMNDNETLSAEEMKAEQEKPLTLKDTFTTADSNKYPYYFDAVIKEAKNEYGIDEEDLLTNGFKIYTALDQDYQVEMTKVYENESLFKNAADGTLLQSASVALNPKTGGVEAVIGGRGEYTFLGFNRATQMKRQPGSVMKPLGVFTPALESGYDIGDMIVDEKLSYGEDNYTPTNLSGTYSETGEVPMYEAVADSLNAPTVWLLDDIGLNKGIKKVEQFGIDVAKEDKNLSSIALGGMDGGVSPLQIASAYSVFANDGYRMTPHFITKIVDATGAVIVDNTVPSRKKVTSPEVSQKMNSMLLGVYESGTAQNNQPSGYKIAGKTGTTETGLEGVNGSKDQWIVGYTPGVVVASWFGFDYTDGNHYLTGYSSQGVGMVLKREMESILPHVELASFDVDSAEHQIAGTESEEFNWTDQFQETTKKIEGQLKNGVDVLQERTANLINKLRDRMSR